VVNLAQLEQQSGHVSEARQRLESLLQSDPGNVPALSLLAQIELASGSLQRAVKLYRQLLKRSPVVNERSNLGLALLLLRHYPEAAEQFRIAADREPGNPLYALNLADALWLLGRKAEAEATYRRVLELIAADPAAPKTSQLLTVRAQALAHLGRGMEAVAAVEEASHLDPANAGVAFEAALVYALLGEANSALVNAGKALRLGYGPRWFDLPWFDRLRARPELARLLRERRMPAP
jgi:tetratricopeptide (TPR) repeat protein